MLLGCQMWPLSFRHTRMRYESGSNLCQRSNLNISNTVAINNKVDNRSNTKQTTMHQLETLAATRTATTHQPRRAFFYIRQLHRADRRKRSLPNNFPTNKRVEPQQSRVGFHWASSPQSWGLRVKRQYLGPPSKSKRPAPNYNNNNKHQQRM